MWAIWLQRTNGKPDWVRTNYGEVRKFRYKHEAEKVASEYRKECAALVTKLAR